MTLLRRPSGAAERLDEPVHDRRVLEQSLEQVAAVNRWLGGERALLKHLPSLLPDPHRSYTLLDVGTGSADLPRRLVDRTRRSGQRRLRICATDLHPQMVEIAHDRCTAYPEIDVRAADARDLPFDDRSHDVVLLSMTLHHLSDEDAVRALAEARRVARSGVLVNELERAVPAYLGALLLAATVWSRNRLTRHDGPLSVRRGYTPDELARLGALAGFTHPVVERVAPYRVVMVGHVARVGRP